MCICHNYELSSFLIGCLCLSHRVHAVAVPVPGCVPIRDLENDMEALGVRGVAATEILDVIEGYIGGGYFDVDQPLKGVCRDRKILVVIIIEGPRGRVG